MKYGPRHRYVLNDKPNQASIAIDIIDALKRHPKAEEVPSDRTIKRRLEDSGVAYLRIPAEFRQEDKWRSISAPRNMTSDIFVTLWSAALDVI